MKLQVMTSTANSSVVTMQSSPSFKSYQVTSSTASPLKLGGGAPFMGHMEHIPSHSSHPARQGGSDQVLRKQRAAEIRRQTKPIMEKKRRARINNSLDELKRLILDALKKDPARHSKLEKADILEMTVMYLKDQQRRQMAVAAAVDPSVADKFRAGFQECAAEVNRYLGGLPAVDKSIKERLVGHVSQVAETLPTASAISGSGLPSGVPSIQVPQSPFSPSCSSGPSSHHQLPAGLSGIHPAQLQAFMALQSAMAAAASQQQSQVSPLSHRLPGHHLAHHQLDANNNQMLSPISMSSASSTSSGAGSSAGSVTSSPPPTSHSLLSGLGGHFQFPPTTTSASHSPSAGGGPVWRPF